MKSIAECMLACVAVGLTCSWLQRLCEANGESHELFTFLWVQKARMVAFSQLVALLVVRQRFTPGVVQEALHDERVVMASGWPVGWVRKHCREGKEAAIWERWCVTSPSDLQAVRATDR